MTLAEIDEIIAELKLAYRAAVAGSSYTINLGGTSRTISRQDVVKLREELQYWQLERQKVESGNLGIRMRFLTPNGN